MNILGFLGRSRAFERSLGESRPRLYRLAYSWCRNRMVAEDIVHETLSKALAQSGQLRDLAALHGWLLAIMANCWKDHYRNRRETEDIDEIGDALASGDAGPDDDYEQSQIVRRVREAISRLPVGQRQVITLVDLEECSYADVAAILGIPIGTVMSRLSRARIALREMLQELQEVAGAARGKLERVK